jgi:cobalt-zinc-cadmium efflux system membrane fusion protein
MKSSLFVLWAVAAGIWLPACEKREVSRPIPPAAKPGVVKVSEQLLNSGQIRVEVVAQGRASLTVRTSGKVGFNEERLSYVSSPLVGRIVEVAARLGEHVEANQTLAVIDSPDLGEAWSDYIKARADLVLAERSYRLAQELWSAKAMARKDFQKAEDDILKAQADTRRTRERLQSLGVAGAELDAPVEALHIRAQYDLAAPIAGTVVERALTLGQMVGADPGQRLFVIADLKTLWVTADLYEKDLPHVQRGDEVLVQAAAWPQEHFEGRIDYVGDTVDPNTRTVKLRLSVDNSRLLLKPEMFVTVAVHTQAGLDTLTIPIGAVNGEGTERPYVFVQQDATQFVARPVTLGAKVDDRVVVTAGLTPSDRVVTGGTILLKAAVERQPAG